MKSVFSSKDLFHVLPVMGVVDGCVISLRGDLTFCWEVTMPPCYSVTEAGYDEIVGSFESALKVLPKWSIVHRQDVYTRRTWKGSFGGSFLSDCFNSHFDGREYLTHRQYLYLTFSDKASLMRSNSSTAAFGLRGNVPLPDVNAINLAAAKAQEFITVVTGNGYMKARRLTNEEIEGTGTEPGLIARYLNPGGQASINDDLIVSPGELVQGGRVIKAYKISEAEQFQGNSISNVVNVTDLSGEVSKVFLSFASAIGSRLDCEHVVNHYTVVPDQQELLRDLDRRRRKMVSMSKDANNNLNAEQLDMFLRKVREETLLVCYSHMNLLTWGPRESQEELRGMVSKAFSSMNIFGEGADYDVLSLFLAGVPGGAVELGMDNFMTQELRSMLCMSINESFDDGMPGGTFLVSDRTRRVPIYLDMALRAQALHHIDNFNVFVLGPSGSGKSFFMNYLLRQCYDNGESVFMIDKGGSYHGLTNIIHELSGGKDGTYMTWDLDNPPSFNPFVGWKDWVDEQGHLRQDANGIQAFLSAVKFLWAPEKGWSASTLAVLERILIDFIQTKKTAGADILIFDDFFRFLGEVIQPRIMPVKDKKSGKLIEPENPLIVAYNPVKPEEFDIVQFIRALSSFSSDGSYSFFLNDPHPRDLVSDRFTVIEVDKIAGDEVFYSLCILFMMNSFDIRMRSTGGFKRFGLDEAWAAIMNPVFEPFILSLWKTARKFQTSAMVVTQELDDILKSSVIRESIIINSDIKILLNQKKNEKRFEELSSLMALSSHQKDIILSMGKAHDPKLPFCTDVYIGMLDCYGVYSIEESGEGVIAFESDLEKKKELFELASVLGNMREALTRIANKRKR